MPSPNSQQGAQPQLHGFLTMAQPENGPLGTSSAAPNSQIHRKRSSGEQLPFKRTTSKPRRHLLPSGATQAGIVYVLIFLCALLEVVTCKPLTEYARRAITDKSSSHLFEDGSAMELSFLHVSGHESPDDMKTTSSATPRSLSVISESPVTVNDARPRNQSQTQDSGSGLQTSRVYSTKNVPNIFPLGGKIPVTAKDIPLYSGDDLMYSTFQETFPYSNTGNSRRTTPIPNKHEGKLASEMLSTSPASPVDKVTMATGMNRTVHESAHNANIQISTEASVTQLKHEAEVTDEAKTTMPTSHERKPKIEINSNHKRHESTEHSDPSSTPKNKPTTDKHRTKTTDDELITTPDAPPDKSVTSPSSNTEEIVSRETASVQFISTSVPDSVTTNTAFEESVMPSASNSEAVGLATSHESFNHRSTTVHRKGVSTSTNSPSPTFDEISTYSEFSDRSTLSQGQRNSSVRNGTMEVTNKTLTTLQYSPLARQTDSDVTKLPVQTRIRHGITESNSGFTEERHPWIKLQGRTSIVTDPQTSPESSLQSTKFANLATVSSTKKSTDALIPTSFLFQNPNKDNSALTDSPKNEHLSPPILQDKHERITLSAKSGVVETNIPSVTASTRNKFATTPMESESASTLKFSTNTYEMTDNVGQSLTDKYTVSEMSTEGSPSSTSQFATSFYSQTTLGHRISSQPMPEASATSPTTEMEKIVATSKSPPNQKASTAKSTVTQLPPTNFPTQMVAGVSPTATEGATVFTSSTSNPFGLTSPTSHGLSEPSRILSLPSSVSSDLVISLTTTSATVPMKPGKSTATSTTIKPSTEQIPRILWPLTMSPELDSNTEEISPTTTTPAKLDFTSRHLETNTSPLLKTTTPPTSKSTAFHMLKSTAEPTLESATELILETVASPFQHSTTQPLRELNTEPMELPVTSRWNLPESTSKQMPESTTEFTLESVTNPVLESKTSPVLSGSLCKSATPRSEPETSTVLSLATSATMESVTTPILKLAASTVLKRTTSPTQQSTKHSIHSSEYTAPAMQSPTSKISASKTFPMLGSTTSSVLQSTNSHMLGFNSSSVPSTTNPILDSAISTILESPTSTITESASSQSSEVVTSHGAKSVTSPGAKSVTSPGAKSVTSHRAKSVTSLVVGPVTSPTPESATSPILALITSPMLYPKTTPYIAPTASSSVKSNSSSTSESSPKATSMQGLKTSSRLDSSLKATPIEKYTTSTISPKVAISVGSTVSPINYFELSSKADPSQKLTTSALLEPVTPKLESTTLPIFRSPPKVTSTLELTLSPILESSSKATAIPELTTSALLEPSSKATFRLKSTKSPILEPSSKATAGLEWTTSPMLGSTPEATATLESTISPVLEPSSKATAGLEWTTSPMLGSTPEATATLESTISPVLEPSSKATPTLKPTTLSTVETSSRATSSLESTTSPILESSSKFSLSLESTMSPIVETSSKATSSGDSTFFGSSPQATARLESTTSPVLEPSSKATPTLESSTSPMLQPETSPMLSSQAIPISKSTASTTVESTGPAMQESTDFSSSLSSLIWATTFHMMKSSSTSGRESTTSPSLDSSTASMLEASSTPIFQSASSLVVSGTSAMAPPTTVSVLETTTLSTELSTSSAKSTVSSSASPPESTSPVMGSVTSLHKSSLMPELSRPVGGLLKSTPTLLVSTTAPTSKPTPSSQLEPTTFLRAAASSPIMPKMSTSPLLKSTTSFPQMDTSPSLKSTRISHTPTSMPDATSSMLPLTTSSLLKSMASLPKSPTSPVVEMTAPQMFESTTVTATLPESSTSLIPGLGASLLESTTPLPESTYSYVSKRTPSSTKSTVPSTESSTSSVPELVTSRLSKSTTPLPESSAAPKLESRTRLSESTIPLLESTTVSVSQMSGSPVSISSAFPSVASTSSPLETSATVPLISRRSSTSEMPHAEATAAALITEDIRTDNRVNECDLLQAFSCHLITETCVDTKDAYRCKCRRGFYRDQTGACSEGISFFGRLKIDAFIHEENNVIPATYTPDLEDPNTTSFLELSELIRNTIDFVFQQDSRTETLYRGCDVIRFRPGSIVTEVQIIMDGRSSWNDTNLEIVLTNAVENGTFLNHGGFIVAANSVLVTPLDECAQNLHDCSEYATCHDQPTRFTCVCSEGYRDLNHQDVIPGRYCEPVDHPSQRPPINQVFFIVAIVLLASVFLLVIFTITLVILCKNCRSPNKTSGTAKTADALADVTTPRRISDAFLAGGDVETGMWCPGEKEMDNWSTGSSSSTDPMSQKDKDITNGRVAPIANISELEFEIVCEAGIEDETGMSTAKSSKSDKPTPTVNRACGDENSNTVSSSVESTKNKTPQNRSQNEVGSGTGKARRSRQHCALNDGRKEAQSSTKPQECAGRTTLI
ncbi:mucin-5AC-like [Acanthaster planci]|uniref:Mucin-5AC-like n=1 Tax=Acanthaster planci TaxID=133434 RepID=A0A8B7Y5L0_ACAPL|nr:mucin-5AC-like [Acanthaster planci]